MADYYGARTLAAVLTGMGDDGARGCRAVRKAGGYVLAQDETSSYRFDMPRSAIEVAGVDLVLPLRRFAFALTTLVAGIDTALGLSDAVEPVGRDARP
jgi:two-component system chemotaxis response regulator CheB